MSQKKQVACPKCGQLSPHQCLGKRFTVYPLGYAYFLGLSLSTFHFASMPLIYRCGSCSNEFRKRTLVGKIALCMMVVLLLSIPAIWILLVLIDQ